LPRDLFPEKKRRSRSSHKDGASYRTCSEKSKATGPPFPGQIKNLEKYQQLTNSPDGLIGLPGDSSPPSRFARIYTLNRFVQKSKNNREAINNANHILNRVTLVNEEIADRITEYGLIRDHKNLVYYVIDDQNMNLRAIDIKKLDLSPGAKKQALSIAADNWFIPANGELIKW
jgi:choloylglycine hydrolase